MCNLNFANSTNLRKVMSDLAQGHGHSFTHYAAGLFVIVYGRCPLLDVVPTQLDTLLPSVAECIDCICVEFWWNVMNKDVSDNVNNAVSIFVNTTPQQLLQVGEQGIVRRSQIWWVWRVRQGVEVQPRKSLLGPLGSMWSSVVVKQKKWFWTSTPPVADVSP